MKCCNCHKSIGFTKKLIRKENVSGKKNQEREVWIYTCKNCKMKQDIIVYPNLLSDIFSI